MGSGISTFNEDEFIIEEAKFWDGSNYESNINKEETITSSNERNENNVLIKQLNGQEENNKTSSTFEKSKSDYIPFTFEWRNEDNSSDEEMEVMITGSFLNDWNTCIPMIKNPKTNIYEYQTSLPKQKHFFKYIINNKWKCSSLYPTIMDESKNVNNYIDLTSHNLGNQNKNVNVNLNVNTKDNNFNVECDVGNYNYNNNIDEGDSDVNKKNNDGYDLKYPLIKDLNLTAPSVISYYSKEFCLEYQSNQNKLCELFLPNKIYKKTYYLKENNGYKKIFDFPNEKIDHLIYNIQDFHIYKKSIRFCTTERKREKLLTLIYYKPK